ncbi:MAG: chemotaxis protein CheW [Pirellulales bacterium]
MSATRQFCTFSVADMFLGIAVEHVQEVLRYQQMTCVPLASTFVAGLINLRGQIVTALDLRHRLHLPPRPADQLPMNVVLRDRDNAVSLLVDRIGDVMEVDVDLHEPVPSTVADDVKNLFVGAYKLPKQLLLVLDDERLLNDGESAKPTDCLLAG